MMHLHLHWLYRLPTTKVMCVHARYRLTGELLLLVLCQTNR